jgi:capsule biosynthesis phosphatase
MKKIVIDIDNTICITENRNYADARPVDPVISRIRELHKAGWYIILYTSRNMNSFDNNIGLINAITLPVILDWLSRHNVPYHEIHPGKPWAREGFYVDDRAVRPKEFVSNNIEELEEICKNDLVD